MQHLKNVRRQSIIQNKAKGKKKGKKKKTRPKDGEHIINKEKNH